MKARLLAAAFAAAALSLAACHAEARPVRVFLFGGWGDLIGVSVFDLAERARRCGADVSVNGNISVDEVRAASRAGAVVLGGMSYGGSIARDLALRASPARVDLLVTLDPPGGNFMPAIGSKPGNVRRCLNFRQKNPILGGGTIARCVNVPLGIDHLDFINDPFALSVAQAEICSLR